MCTTRKMEFEMFLLQIMCFLIGLFHCNALPLASKSPDKFCPELSLPNGEVSPPTPRSPMRNFKCNGGFTLYGAKMSSCIQRGVWYPDIPKCIKSGCEELNLDNGKVQFSRPNKNKSPLISFTCNEGFRRNGTDKLLCDGRTWGDQAPTCVRFQPKHDPVECDFEDVYLCGWSQDINDDFDWTRWSGKTPTDDTGPSTDYTTRSDQGHYVFLETTGQQRGDRANLISMIFQPAIATNECLTFRYHMYGKHVGNLSVFLTPANLDTKKMKDSHRFFHVTGNRSNEWHLGNVRLSKQTAAFKIVIQGTSGGFYGDIALDDVKISKCSEGLKATSKPTSPLMSLNTTSTTEILGHPGLKATSETKAVSESTVSPKSKVTKATTRSITTSTRGAKSTSTRGAKSTSTRGAKSTSTRGAKSTSKGFGAFAPQLTKRSSVTPKDALIADTTAPSTVVPRAASIDRSRVESTFVSRTERFPSTYVSIDVSTYRSRVSSEGAETQSKDPNLSSFTASIYSSSTTDKSEADVDVTYDFNTDISDSSREESTPDIKDTEDKHLSGDVIGEYGETYPDSSKNFEFDKLNKKNQNLEFPDDNGALVTKRTKKPLLSKTNHVPGNINTVKKTPANTESGKSKQKVSLIWFFIVLVLLVSITMILVSVLTWRWAKRNQRAKLGREYDGHKVEEVQSCDTDAETCLGEKGSSNDDTVKAECYKDIVEVKQETTETGITETVMTGTGVTGTELRETGVTGTELKETGVTGTELTETGVIETMAEAKTEEVTEEKTEHKVSEKISTESENLSDEHRIKPGKEENETEKETCETSLEPTDSVKQEEKYNIDKELKNNVTKDSDNDEGKLAELNAKSDELSKLTADQGAVI
ncbi:unnamed protein product [Lymnaea stagnalis]|uniref:Uncharacterized protein n=1 Tax=Lymnaea stagnalis TaxID=6523 RepID=A0AAV2HGW3_LYMST